MGCGASAPKNPDGNEGEPAPERPRRPDSPDPRRRGSYMSPQMGKPSEMTELPLSKERIASYSNHGIKPGVQGKASAKINQDRGQITYPLAGDRGMAMLCVYDGHGMAGEKVGR
eukprot:6185372-Pleurochrysis_carterae.AAC.2